MLSSVSFQEPSAQTHAHAARGTRHAARGTRKQHAARGTNRVRVPRLKTASEHNIIIWQAYFKHVFKRFGFLFSFRVPLPRAWNAANRECLSKWSIGHVVQTYFHQLSS